MLLKFWAESLTKLTFLTDSVFVLELLRVLLPSLTRLVIVTGIKYFWFFLRSLDLVIKSTSKVHPIGLLLSTWGFLATTELRLVKSNVLFLHFAFFLKLRRLNPFFSRLPFLFISWLIGLVVGVDLHVDEIGQFPTVLLPRAEVLVFEGAIPRLFYLFNVWR